MTTDDSSRRKVAAAKSAVVARWLEIRERAAAAQAPAEPDEADGDVGEAGGEEESLLDRYMPTPQVAAVAVMALLAAGVVLGAVTDQFAQSASAPIVLLGSPASAPEEAAAPEAVEEEVIYEAAPEASPAAEAAAGRTAGIRRTARRTRKRTRRNVRTSARRSASPRHPLLPHRAGRPGLRSNFRQEVDLALPVEDPGRKGRGAEQLLRGGPGRPRQRDRPAQRPGPDRADSRGLPRIHRRHAGHRRSRHGRHHRTGRRDGCVYPASTLTLPGQLAAAEKTWKAYVEDIGAEAGAEPATACGARAQPASPTSTRCSTAANAPTSDVGLDQLALDLKSPAETPTFSYIVPNACHDGSELPCAPGQPAGIAGAESFLETVVPEIESSPAYTVGGMIAITFAQAPQTGPAADQRSCCVTPEYPNLKADPNAPPAPAASGPVKPTGGGGRVGMLLISPYVLPGSVNKSSYFNHFVAAAQHRGTVRPHRSGLRGRSGHRSLRRIGLQQPRILSWPPGERLVEEDQQPGHDPEGDPTPGQCFEAPGGRLVEAAPESAASTAVPRAEPKAIATIPQIAKPTPATT